MPSSPNAHVVIVTGPAGAGRSTAINALEDLGFEAIDNLPLRLLPRLLEGAPPDRPLALGIDPRTRDFGAADLLKAYEKLKSDPDYTVDLVYLDCEPGTLLRRYSETRRRHPSAPDADPADGIALERDMLTPLRDRADVLIDTTSLTVHDTRARIEHVFAPGSGARMAIQVTSFSYRRGVPQAADLVFDCRFLRNPHWDTDLRPQTGQSTAVQDYIAQDARFGPFRDQVLAMLDLLLPAFREEGKSHLTVAFGCTGGKHRSVALAEIALQNLAEQGWQVSIRHRDVENGRNRPPPQTTRQGDATNLGEAE